MKTLKINIFLAAVTLCVQLVAKADDLQEFTDIINSVQLETETAYKLGEVPVNDKCVVFMDKQNFQGVIGQAITTEIVQDPVLYAYLLHGGTLNKYCSQYSRMTTKQKANIWVLILTTMAHFESTCNLSSKAKGPNGTAYGYFQLHKGKENIYRSSNNACTPNSSLDAKKSTKCALGMLEVQMQKTQGDLFNKDSYWDVLRPKGQSKKAQDIRRALMRFSMCNPLRV